MSYSSSSTQEKGLMIPFMYDGENQAHRHQEKEWLPSSTSSTTQIDGTSPKNNDDDDNGDDKERQRRGEGEGSMDGSILVEREHMFDKVVTPSDVGKLNRLVIPKQHAEKYFPLDSSTNNSDQKAGLLLNFQDLSGKSWRFRYSYWNSSQSYVMTKGWSRFVKEKQLSAGDIVSFQRGVGCTDDEHKFYIDWRRRPLDRQPNHHNHHHHHHLGTAYAVHRSIPGAAWSSSTPTLFLRSHPYPTPSMPTSIWDHSSISTTTTQLSQVNMMSTVPFAYGSSSTLHTNANTCVVNSHLSRGSLIFVRSSPLSPPSIDPITPHPLNSSSSSLYCHSRGQEGGGVDDDDDDDDRKVYESVPLIQRKAAKRSVRLFGVNVDCPPFSHEDQNSSHPL